jgi:Cys-rich repeat protein
MWNRIGLIGSGAVLAAALMLVGCGSEGGGGATSCSTDTECGTGEICHPDAKACVKTCPNGTECTDEARTCEAVSATNSTKICKCSTSALCQGGEIGPDAVCAEQWEICMSKCASDSDCPSGNTCDTASGQCKKGGSSTCSTSNPQPDACSYGQFCSGTTCGAVPAPTCQNFTTSGHGTSWNASSSTGPVIYEITQVSFGTDLSSCSASQKLARIKVKAYRTSGTFASAPTSTSSELHYVKTDGSEATGSEKPFIFPSSYNVTNNGKNVEFDLGFCPPTSNQFSAGIHFPDGNERCIVAQ